jgi:hypothetical protein
VRDQNYLGYVWVIVAWLHTFASGEDPSLKGHVEAAAKKCGGSPSDVYSSGFMSLQALPRGPSRAMSIHVTIELHCFFSTGDTDILKTLEK